MMRAAGTILQIGNIPIGVDQDEFSRLFLQLDGCQGCKLMKDQTGRY